MLLSIAAGYTLLFLAVVGIAIGAYTLGKHQSTGTVIGWLPNQRRASLRENARYFWVHSEGKLKAYTERDTEEASYRAANNTEDLPKRWRNS